MSLFWIVPKSNLTVCLIPLKLLGLIPCALVWFPDRLSFLLAGDYFFLNSQKSLTLMHIVRLLTFFLELLSRIEVNLPIAFTAIHFSAIMAQFSIQRIWVQITCKTHKK